MRHLDGTHRASYSLLLQLIISHGPIQSVLSLICIHFFGGLSFSCTVKKEHDGDKHFIVSGGHFKDHKDLFFCKLIILQLRIEIVIVNTVIFLSS